MAKNKTPNVTNLDEARAVVLARMEKLGINKNQLVIKANDHGVRRSAVYEFCNGKRPRFNLPDFLGICATLDLTIVAIEAK